MRDELERILRNEERPQLSGAFAQGVLARVSAEPPRAGRGIVWLRVYWTAAAVASVIILALVDWTSSGGWLALWVVLGPLSLAASLLSPATVKRAAVLLLGKL